MSEQGAPPVEALGDGRFRVTVAGRQALAYAVMDGAGVWVWYDGRSYRLSDGVVAGGRGTQDDVSLAAPMPATVRSVTVSVGQKVSAGDVLVVLEAMKMEMTIKSNVDGTVRAIHCVEGQLVQAGVKLVDVD